MIPLCCHPATPCAVLSGLAVEVRTQPLGLVLIFVLDGDLDLLDIPAPLVGEEGAGMADSLWRHTCCEAFVAVPEAPEYREFNFSPSGQWAVYDFSAYRRALPPPALPDFPRIAVHRRRTRLSLEVALPLALYPAGPLEWGFSAVIQARNGAMSYWARAHPAATPDFHHRGAFERVPG